MQHSKYFGGIPRGRWQRFIKNTQIFYGLSGWENFPIIGRIYICKSIVFGLLEKLFALHL